MFLELTLIIKIFLNINKAFGVWDSSVLIQLFFMTESYNYLLKIN